MVADLIATLCAGAPEAIFLGGGSVVVCPPFPYLENAVGAAAGSRIEIGAQNVHPEGSGAYTGEVSAAMLKDMGIDRCIVGHSERRNIFGEDDAFIREKLRALMEAEIDPILCVGENLVERESGHQEIVVRHQLVAALEGMEDDRALRLCVAYEPVWAIGTGKTATAGQAREMHGFIRGLLQERFGRVVAGAVSILYGGSVNSQNAGEILSQPEVDGVLVGGASLEAESFLAIIDHAVS